MARVSGFDVSFSVQCSIVCFKRPALCWAHRVVVRTSSTAVSCPESEDRANMRDASPLRHCDLVVLKFLCVAQEGVCAIHSMTKRVRAGGNCSCLHVRFRDNS